MKFSVKEIDILDSKVGPGLKIGDYTFGCARITQITMEGGKTLKDYALEGMCLGYKATTEAVKPDESSAVQKPAAKTVMVLNTDALNTAPYANNYVLFSKDVEGGVSIIHNTADLVQLFQLPNKDAEEMDKYIGMLAGQRNLDMVRYVDLETGTDSIMFVNLFDREVVEAILDDDNSQAANSFVSMMRSAEFRSELENHNFIKLMVMSVAQTGQDRYNKLNRDDVLAEMAKTFSSIRYWKEGNLCVPSVKDINDYMDQMKEQIRIQ